MDLEGSLEVDLQAQGDPLRGDQPALLPDLAEGQVLWTLHMKDYRNSQHFFIDLCIKHYN